MNNPGLQILNYLQSLIVVFENEQSAIAAFKISAITDCFY
jgi:hypothetical protein